MSESKENNARKPIYLTDYQPPDYLVETIELRFELGNETTSVFSRLSMKRNYHQAEPARSLVLDGEELVLRRLLLDGKPVAKDQYTVATESLTIETVPDAFVLEIETELRPQDNTTLSGLYQSKGSFCTQCEAEGFRRITYYPDRPDVLAEFTTTVVADRLQCPVLLSNGNLIDTGVIDGGLHWAKWHDPFPKPSYLFAVVAGDLACATDEFRTMSGRLVQLLVYVEHHNADKCGHALVSLKKAMQWDEQVYGREYDLNAYMIVAVDDFNMGAMENKGLNVFNSKYVLANAETATDADYEAIEGVIGHEYFHNWSGNRVTCRDWFQLSLKEGFTVYRDQEFSADMTSRWVKRIQDVDVLRTVQFREDSGPMAHPVRPDSYVEINNFYTSTVYNKGAEVIRMLHHFLGAEGFRKGTDLYFERHDGQAVTTDDFVAALEDANDVDFAQFRLWYSQAGTPELHVQRHYDASTSTYQLSIHQRCPGTPGQAKKQPFHIPIAVGLLDSDGRDIPLQLAGETGLVPGTRVLTLSEANQVFTFTGIAEEPTPSLLRGFSAPVKILLKQSEEELCFLMAHDSDAFNRWDASQRLSCILTMRVVADIQQQRAPAQLSSDVIAAFRRTLENPKLDKSLVAQVLSLPAEAYLSEFMDTIDPLAIHQARLFMRQSLARSLTPELTSAYDANAAVDIYSIDQESIGRRGLKNVCLSYLMELEDPAILPACTKQFYEGGNMTDVMAALRCLANHECKERVEALTAFYEKWKDDALVLDKWLSIQAGSRLPDTLAVVRTLITHPAFNLKNPNKVRALIGMFCHANLAHFHAADGKGYEFLAEQLLILDRMNPQIAARLVGGFSMWRKYDAQRQDLMKTQLQQILSTPDLSRDVYEIASKSVA